MAQRLTESRSATGRRAWLATRDDWNACHGWRRWASEDGWFLIRTARSCARS